MHACINLVSQDYAIPIPFNRNMQCVSVRSIIVKHIIKVSKHSWGHSSTHL